MPFAQFCETQLRYFISISISNSVNILYFLWSKIVRNNLHPPQRCASAIVHRPIHKHGVISPLFSHCFLYILYSVSHIHVYMYYKRNSNHEIYDNANKKAKSNVATLFCLHPRAYPPLPPPLRKWRKFIFRHRVFIYRPLFYKIYNISALSRPGFECLGANFFKSGRLFVRLYFFPKHLLI